MNAQLNGIPETLLIALYMRALETKESNPIVKDGKAVEMVNRIDYDFSKFGKAWLSQTGVAIRSTIFDGAVTKFLERHENAVVVNLGAGLDTRFERLGPKNVLWYDLDVPETIELRRKFFQQTEYNSFISKSMFDTSWMEEVKSEGKPVLLIAEGLFMYFEEEELKPLFMQLAENFPGAELLFEMLAPILVGKSKHHDSVSKVGEAEFKWGLPDARTVTQWHPNIEFVEEWDYLDFNKERWRWFRYIARLPFLRKRMSGRVVHLKFADR